MNTTNKPPPSWRAHDHCYEAPRLLCGWWLGEDSRADLAAGMPALLDADRHVRSTVSVIATVDNPTLFQWICHEALAKN